jgi:hypothetical protein
MKFTTPLAVLLAVFTVQVHGYSVVINVTGSIYHHYSLYTRPWALQYTSWYPKYAGIFRNITENYCNESFQEYQAAYNAPADSYNDYLLLMTCYQTEACVYGQLSLDQQMNFQSATVVLGLLPTLLSTIGPSIPEIALLSSYRPVLSFILSLGAPVIWPSRIFEYNDPQNAVISGEAKLSLPPRRAWVAVGISLCQYLFSLAAVANVLSTAIEMCQKSVLVWSCTATFTPLLWTLWPALNHLLAISSYRIIRWVSKRRVSNDPQRLPKRAGAKRKAPNISRKSSNLVRLSRLVARGIAAETRICANHDIVHPDASGKIPLAAIALNVAAGCLAFVHIIFGTAVFSALQFISLTDVMNSILWRLILSTVICRVVLIVELAGLRALKKKH